MIVCVDTSTTGRFNLQDCNSKLTTQDWKSQELRDCTLSQQILEPHSVKHTVTAQCKTASCLIDVKPTLSQVWKQDELISAICVQSVDVHVSCSSHGISELAPFFIDPRAK